MLLRGLMTTVFVLLSLTAGAAGAAADSLGTYTKERPLIYEDVWDLWPYSFLNDKGEPDGFNVDLIRLIMSELQIPYEIKMKPRAEAFRDMRVGKSDLMLTLAVGFNNDFAHASKNAVTLFTQSLVRPKSKPLEVKRFHDLSNHKVIVCDSSLAHHLMEEYGWSDNMTLREDMREAILEVSAKEEGQIVWNTLSLKWLMRRYHTDNLELTPVNMQHGQYKFVSNDTRLLEVLDSVYVKLTAEGRLTPIQNKWFYPEMQDTVISPWVWTLAATILAIILIALAYAVTYRREANKIQRSNRHDNQRLALILETSQVRMWTYHIADNHFAWRNKNGQVMYTYTMEEFSQRYSPEDFKRLKDALEELAKPYPATDPALHTQEKRPNITLELYARDEEGGDTEMRDYTITLSVLESDKEGRPTVLLGTKKDVTRERMQERKASEQTLRYWNIFSTPMVGIMFFDKSGTLININPAACEIYGCKAQELIAEQVSMEHLLGVWCSDISQLEGLHATQWTDYGAMAEEQRIRSIHHEGRICNEFELTTVYDEGNEPIGIFAVCRNKHDSMEHQQWLKRKHRQKAVLDASLERMDDNINMVLRDSDVRLVTYSPQSRVLTIYKSAREIQLQMNQVRCMSLVDDESKKLVLRTINELDSRQNKSYNINILTTLRAKGGKRLSLQFCLMPLSDKNGEIHTYMGLCRDLTELHYIREHMAISAAKVQEVEDTKNSFVKNMVQEIRKPMNTVIDYVSQLGVTAPTDNEPMLQQGISENSDYLLHLINNILYLSRLEARMVDISRRSCNFAELFEGQCKEGWNKYRNANTRYVVENPYEQLVVNIDAENIGQAIKQVTENAAQHTKSGIIRARCEYIGRRLIISVDDTGEGIPHDELRRINNHKSGEIRHTKGLGLAICQELMSQMDGTLEINSEEGSGTTVYFTIPCHATVIKRKKLS